MHRTSRWWQRLHPFWRVVQWCYRGGTSLEKNSFLERLSKSLRSHRCAVGWNSDFQEWDLKIRRGALGEATLRTVVEHHGGPRRLARFSVTVKPPKLIYFFHVGLGGLAWVTGTLGLYPAFAMVMVLLAVSWVAPIIEASRLEDTIRFTADEVAQRLAAEDSGEA